MDKHYVKILLIFVIFSLGINLSAETKNHFDNNLEVVGSEKTTNISDDYRLYQNFPNPFNPATIINYKINQRGFVTLKVFDIAGRELSTLINELRNAGAHSITFNGSYLSSGVYFYKLESNGFIETKRMMLVK